MRRHPALVVDGDATVREVARDAFSAAGLPVRFVERVDEALSVLSESGASVLLLDPRGSGAGPETFLTQALRASPETVPLVIGSVETADSLLEAGAFEVVSRAPTAERLERSIRRAIRQHERLDDLARFRSGRNVRGCLPPLVGRSEVMAALWERLGEAAATEDSVLLVGEEGSGRSLAARLLHALSARSAGPFVPLDLRAALGGGIDRIVDAAENARGGVLYLAEAEELGEVSRQSASSALGAAFAAAQARVVSSSRTDLGIAVLEGRFGPELARQLAARTVRIPPLRERGRDAVVLARHFVDAVRRRNDLPPIRIAPDAISLLEAHDWPGNVRELQDAIEHALTLAVDGVILAEHLPDSIRRGAERKDSENPVARARRFREAKRKIVDSFERAYLEELLAWHGGNVTTAAEQAGMLRSALQRLLRKHELKSEEYRRSFGRRPAADA